MKNIAVNLLKAGAGIATGAFASNIALATTPANATKIARASATIGASITGILVSEMFVDKVVVPAFNDLEDAFNEISEIFKKKSNDK